MRLSTLLISGVAAALVTASAARACDARMTECLPTIVVFPAYTPEGLRIGTVEARVSRRIPMELSRFTGQPVTVLFNSPGRLPGSIDPEVRLMPLPRVRPFNTQAVYPKGY